MSNDLENWFELSSLKGTEFKYFKMEVNLIKMKAVDTYSGTVIDFIVRRDFKMR